MRSAILAILLLGGSLAMSSQAIQPAPPALPAKSESVVTRAQLEQRLVDLKAAKEQAIANVNAFEGAIQECQRWIDQLQAADTKHTTEKAPKKK